MKAKLNTEAYNFWNIFIQIIASVLTISTIIIALISYISNEREERAQQEKEYRKELSNKQMDYYAEISQAIGDLLTVMSYRDSIFTKTYFNKRNNFEALYYGKMNLIESAEVDRKWQEFKGLLEKYETDDSGLNIHDLRLAAFQINDEFRKSIQKTFDVKLDKLTK